MDVKGQESLPASPDEAWDLLNDPAVLAACIPGCKALHPEDEGAYRMELELGIAAVKGRYQGRVEIRDPLPPATYTLHIEAQGAQGFLSADIPIRLESGGEGTVLTYDGRAEVGGLIAGVGQRMIAGVARSVTRQFFDALARQIAARPAST